MSSWYTTSSFLSKRFLHGSNELHGAQVENPSALLHGLLPSSVIALSAAAGILLARSNGKSGRYHHSEFVLNALAAGCLWGIFFFDMLPGLLEDDSHILEAEIGKGHMDISMLIVFSGYFCFMMIDQFCDQISDSIDGKAHCSHSELQPHNVTPVAMPEKSMKFRSINLRSIGLAFCFIIHGFCEGISISSFSSLLRAFLISVPFFAHKWIESYTVYKLMETSNASFFCLAVTMGLIITATPLGIYTGILLKSCSSAVWLVLNCIATGIIFHICIELTNGALAGRLIAGWKVILIIFAGGYAIFGVVLLSLALE